MNLTSNTKEVNDEKVNMKKSIVKKDDKYFIPLSEVNRIYNIQVDFDDTIVLTFSFKLSQFKKDDDKTNSLNKIKKKLFKSKGI